MKRLKIDKQLILSVFLGIILALAVLVAVRLITLISWSLFYGLIVGGLTILIHGLFKSYDVETIDDLIEEFILDIQYGPDEEDEFAFSSEKG